jgi:hypothetical protein
LARRVYHRITSFISLGLLVQVCTSKGCTVIGGNDKAVRSSKMLTTGSFDRLVINHMLEVFKLDAGMDGLMCLVDGILMHDQDFVSVSFLEDLGMDS